MAQRLVRKLCPSCKKEVAVEGASQQEIEEAVLSIEDKSLIPLARAKMFVAVGCDKCNNTGYKGRVGIYEAILSDKKIEDAVEMNPSEREIWIAAQGQGILTMKQDGVLKILSGITSLDELKRVISITD
jgi:type IV pilus assembly protein PilB